MTVSASSPLRYVLPTTVLTLSAAARLAVVADEKGGHLEPEVTVSISSRWRQRPLVSAAPVVLPAGVTPPAWSAPGSLRREFDRSHPRTAALIADLAARADQFLAGLRMGEATADVLTFGSALEVVNRELAAADRMRREWTAGRSRALRTFAWDLTLDDLVPLDSCPQSLPADTAVPEGPAAALARDYGVLVVLVESGRTAVGAAGAAVPATVAVYRRAPRDLPDVQVDPAAQPWTRDDALFHLHLVEDDEPGAPRAAVPAGALVPDGALPSGLPVGDVLHVQLELLMASDEVTQLAAAHARADELATIAVADRIAQLPHQRPAT